MICGREDTEEEANRKIQTKVGNWAVFDRSLPELVDRNLRPEIAVVQETENRVAASKHQILQKGGHWLNKRMPISREGRIRN